MTYLDCHDVDSVIASFASVSGKDIATVADAFRSCEVRDFDRADVEDNVPRAVLRGLGIAEEISGFDGAFFFHGARVIDPSDFLEQGILPLNQCLDRIWSDLYQTISHLVTEREWRAHRDLLEHGGGGGDSGGLYRLKTGNAVLGGPFGHLVREQHLRPLECQHAYLSVPEIVQDVARTCTFDLQNRFEKATTPCVVKFRVDDIDWGMITTAFWYAFSCFHGDAPSLSVVYSWSGNGLPVAPDDIVHIETLDPGHGRRARAAGQSGRTA